MTKTTRYIDLGFCLTMAIVMHFVFPVHRWFSEAPLSAFFVPGVLLFNVCPLAVLMQLTLTNAYNRFSLVFNPLSHTFLSFF